MRNRTEGALGRLFSLPGGDHGLAPAGHGFVAGSVVGDGAEETVRIHAQGLGFDPLNLARCIRLPELGRQPESFQDQGEDRFDDRPSLPGRKRHGGDWGLGFVV